MTDYAHFRLQLILDILSGALPSPQHAGARLESAIPNFPQARLALETHSLLHSPSWSHHRDSMIKAGLFPKGR